MVGFATLRDDLWTSTYNFIQTGSYAITTGNIYASFNDKLVTDIGFPLVIISKPKVTVEQLGMGSLPLNKISGTVEITIYHNTAEGVKTVTDEVANKFETGGRSSFSNGWYFKQFEDDEEGADDEDNKKYHHYTLNLKFGKE